MAEEEVPSAATYLIPKPYLALPGDCDPYPAALHSVPSEPIARLVLKGSFAIPPAELGNKPELTSIVKEPALEQDALAEYITPEKIEGLRLAIRRKAALNSTDARRAVEGFRQLGFAPLTDALMEELQPQAEREAKGTENGTHQKS